MEKRILRNITSLIFVITLASVIFTSISPVRANPDMSINSDGSITQSGNFLQLFSDVSGVKTYIFSANISDRIIISRSNIVLNGAGKALIGTGSGNGFTLSDGVNNVVIGNLSVVGFDVGILNRDGSNNRYLNVGNVTIQSCNTGILLGGIQSGYATIINVTFLSDGKGIYAYNGAGNNLISGNSFSTSNNCVEINSAPNNTIYGNGLISNPNGNGVSLTGNVRNTVISWNTFSNAGTGVEASYGINDTTISNNIFAYTNCGVNVGGNENGWSSNITVTQNDIYATQNPTIIFTYVKNSVISQNTLKTWSSSIINFDHSNYNSILNNNLTSTKSTGYCMSIYFSNYTTIANNNMYSSTPDQTNAIGVGIAVTLGYYNSIIGNVITNPNSFGFKLDIADFNTVTGNTVWMKFNGASPTGIWFTEGASYNNVNNNVLDGRNDVNCSTIGMQINTGANNVISGNTIVNNKYGLTFNDYLFATTNNSFVGNTIQNNGIGAEIYSSTLNYFYNNNFLSNSVQVQTDYYGTPLHNYWNTTFAQGGNYWSNYLGADTNGDGIGDTPYVIDAANIDNYPYMNPLYHITVTQSAHGTITSGTGLVTYGSTPNYIITPDVGYHIVGITANGVPISVTSPSGQSYQFAAVTTDCSLSATYAINTYTVAVTQTANGNINPGTTTNINYGATPSFAVTPNTGYHITSIMANGTSVPVTSPSGQTFQFSPISADGWFTATYAINTYAFIVTQTANGVISPGNSTFNYGDSRTFTITPSTGYHIASLTVDGSAVTIASSYSFNNIQSNHNITATYAINTFTTTVTQTANGVISPGTTTINYGDSQSFTITPNTGYYIASITNDAGSVTVTSSSGQTVSFTNVQATHTITATFAQTPTPTPTPTPVPTSAPTSNPTTSPTNHPTATQRPATPTPAPSPSPTTVPATTDTGSTVELTISGNVTSTQISSITISADQSAGKTTVSFTISGASGSTGFGNLTIPKSAVAYGTTPTIYIDNQPASSQGYTQDSSNYYVWYTTHFSTHQVSIQFTGSAIPEYPSTTILSIFTGLAIFTTVALLLIKRGERIKALK